MQDCVVGIERFISHDIVGKAFGFLLPEHLRGFLELHTSFGMMHRYWLISGQA